MKVRWIPLNTPQVSNSVCTPAVKLCGRTKKKTHKRARPRLFMLVVIFFMQLDSKYKHWPILLWLICINLRMFWLFDVILRYHSWQMTTKDCRVYWCWNTHCVSATAWPSAHCLPVFQVTETLGVKRLHFNLHDLSKKIIILIINQLFWHARHIQANGGSTLR